METHMLDAAGRRRSPATIPGYRAGHAPRNKGMRYPADPPRIEEIVAVMRQAGDGTHGARIRGLIVVLWRAGPEDMLSRELETDAALRRGSRNRQRRGRWRSVTSGLARRPRLCSRHSARPSEGRAR